jgi:hypothetical protein
MAYMSLASVHTAIPDLAEVEHVSQEFFDFLWFGSDVTASDSIQWLLRVFGDAEDYLLAVKKLGNEISYLSAVSVLPVPGPL